jgi:hypothetical protein
MALISKKKPTHIVQASIVVYNLFTQVHTPVLIQLPEVRIPEVFDETYSLTC